MATEPEQGQGGRETARPLVRAGVFGLLLMATSAGAGAQDVPERLEVGPLHQVSADLPSLPHVEPVIAVNPRDPGTSWLRPLSSGTRSLTDSSTPGPCR
jgi:hypothetical protein